MKTRLLILLVFAIIFALGVPAGIQTTIAQEPLPTPTPTLAPPDDSSEPQPASVPQKAIREDQQSIDSLEVLETLIVPVDGTLVQTSFNLAEGVVYTIRVSGVYKWGDCDAIHCPGGGPDYIRWGDAEYLTDDNWQGFSDEFWSAFVYFEVNGSDLDFGPFNPEHIYSIQIPGNGQPATFRLHDCDPCYGDNAGSLTVEILVDMAAVKARFLEAFGELNKEFKPFDPRLPREELLALQEISLEPAEEAVASAQLLPGATLPSIEDIPPDIILNLLHIPLCLYAGINFCIHPFIPPAIFCSGTLCTLNGEVKMVKASEFQLFSFDLSVGIEKEALELFNPGDRFVTALPFLGFSPSFSIVEVVSVTEDIEFGIIEFSIEGVSAVPEQEGIDIKPGSNPNSINPENKGKIPVAILSTADFDAPAQVDKTLLTFGRLGNEKSLVKCNKSGEDVNSDGLLDQVCHFNTQDARFQEGDSEGILTGSIADDLFIQGRDSVEIVPEN